MNVRNRIAMTCVMVGSIAIGDALNANAQFGGSLGGAGGRTAAGATSNSQGARLYVSKNASSGTATKAGGVVTSFPCDPLMSASREKELLAELDKPSPFSWEAGTPLSSIADDLSGLFPVRIEDRALEEIGLDRDEETFGGARFNPRSGATKRSSEKTRWWRPQGSGDSSPHPVLIVDLLDRIRDLDLTLMIRHGQLIITTIERAEDEPATRIYDVTPLLGKRRSWTGYGMVPVANQESWEDDFDSLMMVIESSIDPDTWESLGGMSTMVPSPIRSRNWLVITTTTVTHWKIQRLLDRLNQ